MQPKRMPSARGYFKIQRKLWAVIGLSGNVREPRTGSRQYSWHVRHLKMGPIGCNGTSVTNYIHSLRNTLQQRKHQIYCGGNLKFVLQAAWQYKVPLWDLDAGLVTRYCNAFHCCLWLPYYYNIVSEGFVIYRAIEVQTFKRILTCLE
jgi:hypothetical protein